MKIFSLIGHAGCHNRGCEAILASTVAMLEKTFGADVHFNLASFRAQNDIRFIREHQNVLPISAGTTPTMKGLIQAELLRRIGLRSIVPYPPKLWPLRKPFKKSAAVLSVGGDMFTEDYGNPWEIVVEPLLYAHSLGVKTCIWGASIGPFHDPILKQGMRSFLKQVSLITVREQVTMDYLINELGVQDNVKRVADPAFLLKPLHKIDIKEGLKITDQPIIGLNISGLITRRAPGGGLGMIKACSTFVQQLIAKGLRFVFVPHDELPGCAVNPFSLSSDRHVLRFLMDFIGIGEGNDSIRMLPENLNASEIKDAISQCDFYIGAKTHSLIGALSSCVPTIGISYSHKTSGIFNDLFGHLDYVIADIDLTSDQLIKTFNHLQSTRESCINTLQRVIPERQVLATSAARHLQMCLD